MSELARRATTPAKAAKKTAAKKAPAKKGAAKKAAKKVPAKKAAAKKAPAKKAAAKKSAAKKSPPHNAGAQRAHKKAAKPPGGGNASERRAAAASGPSMKVPELPAPAVDPMALLGLDEPLTLAELRRAWRAFAARHHPDRGGDALTFARGQHAYDVLKYRLAQHD